MEQYEIQVVGHIDQRRARALGCEQLRLLPGGQSVLTFAAVDQSALYGLIGRLRDAGLELVAAGRIPDPVSQHGGAPTMPTRVVPLVHEGDTE
jgi:hypothetical protein